MVSLTNVDFKTAGKSTYLTSLKLAQELQICAGLGDLYSRFSQYNRQSNILLNVNKLKYYTIPPSS